MSTRKTDFLLFFLLFDSSAFTALDMNSKLLLLQKARQTKVLMVMLSGPTAVIKFWPCQPVLEYSNIPFDLFRWPDNWCIAFLRFTKVQLSEMAYLLDISEVFPGAYKAPATTALSLDCYRLAWPKRLKDCANLFGHSTSWISTVFNYTCVHITQRFRTMLQWNDNHLTPENLSRYCTKIQGKGEPSGLIWEFIDGTYKQVC